MQQAWSCQYSDLKTEPSSNSQFTPCKGHDLITSRHAVGQAEWWRLEPSRSPKHPSRLIGMKPQDTSPNPLGLQDKSFPFRTSSSINWMDYNIIKVICPNVHLFSINLQHMRYLYIYIYQFSPSDIESKATRRALSFIRTSWAICKPSATKSTSEVCAVSL